MSKVNLHPYKCNLCGGEVIHTTNDIVYGKRYGSGYCYYCTDCKAYVGTHRPKPEESLGLLANEPMRRGKMMCHEIFDSKWKGKKKSKEKQKAMYEWLAWKMNMPIEDCHFGYFDLEELRKAYKILLTIQEKALKYDKKGKIIN